MRYDPLSPKQRSERMSRVRREDTKPELKVRQIVHGMSYRYRLHSKKLPGRPDMVFGKKKRVIFIHGCFWHQHDCNHYRMPKSRQDFWRPKLSRNVERDKDTYQSLLHEGWGVLIIWECQLRDLDSVRRRIQKFLE